MDICILESNFLCYHYVFVKSLHVLGLIEDVGEDTNQAKHIGNMIEQNVKKDFSKMHGRDI